MSELGFDIQKVRIVTVSELFGFRPLRYYREDVKRKDLDEKIELFYITLYGKFISCLCVFDNDLDSSGNKINYTDRPRHLSKIVVRVTEELDDAIKQRVTKLKIIKNALAPLSEREKLALMNLITATLPIVPKNCYIE